MASVTAKAQGREQLKTDLHQALVWFEHTIEYTKSNSAAVEVHSSQPMSIVQMCASMEMNF
jgi:hypothetical protein